MKRARSWPGNRLQEPKFHMFSSDFIAFGSPKAMQTGTRKLSVSTAPSENEQPLAFTPKLLIYVNII